MIESRRGDGFASVSDVTIELELAVRRRGQAEDDKAASAACPGCRRATEVFNRNVGGLRDQILQDSYPLTRLREFFKAYFAAKILIQKEPGLRQRILRSVQVPVTDCLPERFIPSLVITVNACDQLVDGACPHSDHEWSCGLPFGGGISFQKELKPVELNSPLADPVLAPVAPLIQAVAQNGDAMVVRGNRVVMRVALEPATHLAPLAQIDLEEPIVIPADSKPGLETALRRRGDRDYLLLCVSCVLPAFFLAGSFRSRALFTNKGTLAFLTLLVALFMAVAAIFGESAGLAPALLALCAFAAGGLLLFRPRWAIPPCALLHASIACAALFAVLGKPISAGSIPWSAASLAALAALGLLAWRPSGTAASDVCFHCRRVDRGSLLLSVALLASLSGVFLFVVAAVSFEAADYTSAPLGGPVATSVLYAVLVGALFSAPAFALRRVLVQDAQLVPAALAFAALAVATATPIAVGPPSWRRSLLDRVGGTVIDFSRLDAAVGVALKAGAVFSFIYLAWGVWRVRHVKSSS